MEKIISFLLVIGISILFEGISRWWRKGNDSSRQDESDVKSSSFANFFKSLDRQTSAMTRASRMAPFAIHGSEDDEEDDEADMEANIGQALPPTAHSVESPHPSIEPHPSIAEMTEPESDSMDETMDRAPLRLKVDESDAAVAEHYRRWRQAIIDSEIIRPKYIDRN
ncbi:MAG: hypothetical protein NC411_08535 [Bacteroides sp.]|nr:hypothetical protein [Bacteroides sp.]